MLNERDILVVEDSPVQAELLRRLLVSDGYTVTVAGNGKQALSLMEHRRPRLVVSDILMPEMDGYELTGRIKADDALKSVPVLLLTTLSDADDVIRGLEARADGYLTKPYDPDYLLSKIRSVLETPRDDRGQEDLQELKISIDGKPHTVAVDPRGMFDLLVSAYENTVHTNQSVLKAQAELRELNQQLEQKVKERTAHLESEIAKRRRAEEELRVLNESLVERNRSLTDLTSELEGKTEEIQMMTQQLWQTAKLATIGELAASIAHELNNPLATVSLRTETLMLTIPEDHPDHKALDVIEQETQRMGNLVANLLQFSRRYQPQISTIRVREEVDKTLELIHGHLRNHRIEVVRECAQDLPPIRVDRQQFRQVFLNLFTNASDGMPNGGKLTVHTAVVPNQEWRVIIQVSDTGVGIAPENLAKIMEPFFTTKPEGKGTGLGLPICKRIIAEHGGTMKITSEVDRGTTVSIELPLANGRNVGYLTDEGGDSNGD